MATQGNFHFVFKAPPRPKNLIPIALKLKTPQVLLFSLLK